MYKFIINPITYKKILINSKEGINIMNNYIEQLGGNNIISNIVEEENNKLKIGTDCSGIESVLYALNKLNIAYQHMFSCDNNKSVKESILANFKPAVFYDDIFNRDIKKMKYVDLYVCGFPCQPFSSAGKRLGFEDKIKGTVFFECYNYIKTKKPRIFILENVKGLVNHNSGNTFKVILEYLNNLNIYTIVNFVLNTKHYGLPQNRERIFIIGILKKYQKKKFKIPKPFKLNTGVIKLIENINDKDLDLDNLRHLSNFERKNLKLLGKKYIEKGIDINKTPIIADLGASYKFMSSMIDLSPTLKASRCNYYITTLKRKLSPREVLGLQGFPSSFNIAVSDNQIYQQVGNSISVNVLYYILKEIFNSINYIY